MKKRLLVMNGQCIVQKEEGGAWENHKVSKAGELKPGIYNLYLGAPPDKTHRHDGVIVHADGEHVSQQVGRNFVSHSRSDFNQLPDIGRMTSISYNETGKASVTADGIKLGRGRSR